MSSITHSRLYKPSQYRQLRHFDNYPPSVPRGPLPPIRDLQSFAAVQHRIEHRVKEYILFPRPGYQHAACPRDLRRDAAINLGAGNSEARINFATIAQRQMLEHPGIIAGPVYSVTISPAAYAMPVGDEGLTDPYLRSRARKAGPAAKFDQRKLKGLAHQALQKIPFIGMIEGGLFKNWGPDGACNSDHVSWHCHLLAWGVDRSAILQAVESIKQKHKSLHPTRTSPVTIKRVNDFSKSRHILYIFKGHIRRYRLCYFRREWVNKNTGKVSRPGWHLKKDAMRTGDQIRMADVCSDMYLDKLLFGGNEGADLAKSIISQALLPFNLQELRNKANRGY